MSQKYAESGVDISAGDAASRCAGREAKKTFLARMGMMGSAVDLPGGFAGILDMGDFYAVHNCDGVGTKIDLAEKNDAFDELGADLLAMVADDAVCVGAEPVSMVNTFDVEKINAEKIERMMKSLSEACIAQKIVISGGEIAELGNLVSGATWNATALGILEKTKFLSGQKIKVGDTVIALEEKGFRANGFSLVRKILRDNHLEVSDFAKKCLRGSTIYADAILEVLGRFGQKSQAEIRGMAHITGGGIPGNFFRILPPSCGARLDHLFAPGAEMQELKAMGSVSTREFFEVWNAGNGMLLVSAASEAEKIREILASRGIAAQIAGEITDSGKIEITAWNGEKLEYERT